LALTSFSFILFCSFGVVAQQKTTCGSVLECSQQAVDAALRAEAAVAALKDRIASFEKLLGAIPMTARITAGMWNSNHVEQQSGWMKVQWEQDAKTGLIRLKFEPKKFKNAPFVLATSESLYRVYVSEVTPEYAIIGTQGYPSSGHGMAGIFWFVIIPNE
jgi:hypothetical protein